MKNKQELLEQQKKLQEELDRLKELIEEVDNTKRWRAKKRVEGYYTVTTFGEVDAYTDFYGYSDDYSYLTGNYFRTKQEAEAYRDNLITKQKLKDLALRLNAGEEIDWEDIYQNKYNIYYDYIQEQLLLNWQQTNRTQGVIHCINAKFLEEAIKEIGEAKLIELIKSGV